MNPDILASLVLAITAVSLGLAGYFFFATFDLARPMLPEALREEMTGRFAVERFIRSGAAPLPARRSFFLSHAFGCIGLFGMTVLAAGDSSTIVVWLLAGATVVAGVITGHSWRRYREN